MGPIPGQPLTPSSVPPARKPAGGRRGGASSPWKRRSAERAWPGPQSVLGARDGKRLARRLLLRRLHLLTGLREAVVAHLGVEALVERVEIPQFRERPQHNPVHQRLLGRWGTPSSPARHSCAGANLRGLPGVRPPSRRLSRGGQQNYVTLRSRILGRARVVDFQTLTTTETRHLCAFRAACHLKALMPSST